MRKRTPVLPRKTILLTTASPAIAAYFSRVRKDCRYVNMTVECVPAEDLAELIKVTGKQRIAGKFSKAWAVFSFADFGLKADDVKAAMPLAEARKVQLGWVNPSLSMWLFLHLKPLNVYVEGSASFDQAIGKVFPGYAATAEYMTNEGQDLHLTLFSSFSKAVINAGDYNRICEKKTGLAATSFVSMYEDIKEICGEADLSHNLKVIAK